MHKEKGDVFAENVQTLQSTNRRGEMANKTVHPEPSAWVIGLTSFAALMLILIGLFNAVIGISFAAPLLRMTEL